MRSSFLFILLVYSFALCPAKGADLINDTSTLDQLRIGINQIYNCDFDEAENTLVYLREFYPSHPVTPFFEGHIYYWKFYPLIPGKPGAAEFEEIMEETWQRSRRLKEDGNETEGVFFELMSRAFIVMYYADNGHSSRAISHLGKIYRDIMAGFDLQEQFNEFLFITGLYNYYREAYPEAHPAYKPAAIFFRKGDKSKGLEMLKMAAEETDFMRVEAALFLSLIYINYESKIDSAVLYASALHQNYPGNGYFLSKYAEMLLADKQYEKALDPILRLMSLDDYNKMKGTIFMGVYEEKKLNNPEKSRIYYEEGLRLADAYDERANYIKAYAYIGLSRYFLNKGDDKQARAYKKKANNAAGYAYIFSDQPG
jgi:tetratricopeptide (TPR) repeat protein